jgi:hypothetical protein
MLPAHLAENIRQQVLYYLQSTDVADRIEVTHLHALARTICFRSGWRGRRCISASMLRCRVVVSTTSLPPKPENICSSPYRKHEGHTRPAMI